MSDIIMNKVKWQLNSCFFEINGKPKSKTKNSKKTKTSDSERQNTASYTSEQNIILQTRDTTKPEVSSQEAFTSIDCQNQTIPPTPQNKNEQSETNEKENYNYAKIEMEIYKYQETQDLLRCNFKETDCLQTDMQTNCLLLTFEVCGFVDSVNDDEYENLFEQ
ncbi:Hypothetical_protein [Hexamita inflata]|uniref:Hypothetical_protein n=1 Tax=Hexamita inflata TaxID=28002 RepID=A0AA86TV86_9EUKA|nr:Hypothetical protein HINF_LOCUS17820 [Hexamita inflata]